MGAANCLITNIFQNIFFCVKQKNETHTVLEQLEGEEIITIFIFGWTIPLRMMILYEYGTWSTGLSADCLLLFIINWNVDNT